MTFPPRCTTTRLGVRLSRVIDRADRDSPWWRSPGCGVVKTTISPYGICVKPSGVGSSDAGEFLPAAISTAAHIPKSGEEKVATSLQAYGG